MVDRLSVVLADPRVMFVMVAQVKGRGMRIVILVIIAGEIEENQELEIPNTIDFRDKADLMMP